MTIKWIIFDVWGVIYYPSNLIEEMLVPFVQERNNKISKNQIHQQYYKASKGNITSKDIWGTLGFENDYPEIEEQYINSHQNILDVKFIDIIEPLKEKYQLGIISNDVKEWSYRLLEKFDIRKHFDLLYISGDIKIRKPNIEIFQIFINESQTIPEECLFIDDRLENLKSAGKLGMHTLRFIRKDDKIPFCSEFEISSFAELINVLNTFFS
jgi:putative hydrolase of the HAD superfamily